VRRHAARYLAATGDPALAARVLDIAQADPDPMTRHVAITVLRRYAPDRLEGKLLAAAPIPGLPGSGLPGSGLPGSALPEGWWVEDTRALWPLMAFGHEVDAPSVAR
jgi:hypothetical protein